MKRLIRVGDSVLIGGNTTIKKTRHFRDKSVSYNKEAVLVTSELTILNYNMGAQYVILSDNFGDKIHVNFNIQPLNIGYYGQDSYMHPSMLKFSHPGFIENLSENNICVHRVTQERCRLILDNDFIQNGEFRLESITDGEKTSRRFKSEKWDRGTLRDYLDSTKGKALKGKAKVGYIIYKDVCHESVLASPSDSITLVLIFEDGTMMSLPYEHFEPSIPRNGNND